MAAALMLATPAKAQFSWGVKGGVSLGNKSLPELKVEGETLSLNNYGGFFIGPKAEVRIDNKRCSAPRSSRAASRCR